LEFEPKTEITTDNFAVQISFLHTDKDRKRVIRVINYCSSLSNDPAEIYENSDSNVIAQGIG